MHPLVSILLYYGIDYQIMPVSPSYTLHFDLSNHTIAIINIIIIIILGNE